MHHLISIALIIIFVGFRLRYCRERLEGTWLNTNYYWKGGDNMSDSQLDGLFQARDALQLLCDKGYDLGDMLVECKNDIESIKDKIK